MLWQVNADEFFDCFRFLLGGWGSDGLQLPASAAHGLAAEHITHVPVLGLQPKT